MKEKNNYKLSKNVSDDVNRISVRTLGLGMDEIWHAIAPFHHKGTQEDGCHSNKGPGHDNYNIIDEWTSIVNVMGKKTTWPYWKLNTANAVF